jgi:hypothetical protein
VQHSINLYTAKLADITSRISLHEHTLKLIVIASSVRLAIADMGLSIGTTLVLLMSGRLSHLLTVHLLLLVVDSLLALLWLWERLLMLLSLWWWLLLLM